jgi:hypothetical protein
MGVEAGKDLERRLLVQIMRGRLENHLGRGAVALAEMGGIPRHPVLVVVRSAIEKGVIGIQEVARFLEARPADFWMIDEPREE